jgi:hypothetical protein
MTGGEQMRRYFPISLVGLVVTGGVFVLQAIPFTGIFLMFAFAMAWSIVLVNASMIGVAIEAVVGRVSRLWLLLPLIFYGGYWTAAALDHFALRDLASRTDSANAQVVTGFDPARQALVFAKGGAWDGAWREFRPTGRLLRQSQLSRGITVQSDDRQRGLRQSPRDTRAAVGLRTSARFP